MSCWNCYLQQLCIIILHMYTIRKNWYIISLNVFFIFLFFRLVRVTNFWMNYCPMMHPLTKEQSRISKSWIPALTCQATRYVLNRIWKKIFKMKHYLFTNSFIGGAWWVMTWVGTFFFTSESDYTNKSYHLMCIYMHYYIAAVPRDIITY